MIDPITFLKILKKKEIKFITGVPDSAMEGFCSALFKFYPKNNFMVSSSEGSALSFCIGYYLAKKKIPIIYLQNSGLGNLINPLVSLTHKKIYSIPLLLMIGWRGYKNESDEPQHLIQGSILQKQLGLLGISYDILNKKEKNLSSFLDKVIHKVKKKKSPHAILVRRDTFSNNFKNLFKSKYSLSREIIVEEIVRAAPKNVPIISTTGMISRELMKKRKFFNKYYKLKDFYVVGGMGHANQIAAGIAYCKSSKVICLDGDGSVLMHLGSLSLSSKLDNFVHIIIDNESHLSVGGQPSAGKYLEYNNMAKNLGYKNVLYATNYVSLLLNLKNIFQIKGSTCLVIKSNVDPSYNLPRPGKNLVNLKKKFMNFLETIN
jgi:phosphonopyruvate decarboxylase